MDTARQQGIAAVGIVEGMCALVMGERVLVLKHGKQALPQTHGWRPFERDRFSRWSFGETSSTDRAKRVTHNDNPLLFHDDILLPK